MTDESRFGTANDSIWGYAIRRVAYLPLSILERSKLVRRVRAPFLTHRRDSDAALFARTQGLHGASLEAAVRFTHKAAGDLEGQSVLVVGCGDGREVLRWARERPSMTVGQDILDLSEQWSGEQPGVAFVRSDISQMPFADGAFDVVFAKAVLEHLEAFEECIAEIARVMRPGGVIWSDFGPLWYSYGGPHDANIGYEQVVLDDSALEKRFHPHSEGRLFWAHRMFSRLRPAEYREILERFFEIDRWCPGVSPEGMRFKRRHPDRWAELLRSESEETLLTSAIYFLGRRR